MACKKTRGGDRVLQVRNSEVSKAQTPKAVHKGRRPRRQVLNKIRKMELTVVHSLPGN